MQDWREETATDLKDAKTRLAALRDSVSGDPTDAQLGSLWRAYLDVEKSVFFVKVELDVESPGVFVNKKLFKVPDERQAIAFALDSLRKGELSFQAGDLERALKELRESRNYLRVLLREKQLSRARKTVKAPHR